jgi:hypothetical protein
MIQRKNRKQEILGTLASLTYQRGRETHNSFLTEVQQKVKGRKRKKREKKKGERAKQKTSTNTTSHNLRKREKKKEPKINQP